MNILFVTNNINYLTIEVKRSNRDLLTVMLLAKMVQWLTIIIFGLLIITQSNTLYSLFYHLTFFYKIQKLLFLTFLLVYKSYMWRYLGMEETVGPGKENKGIGLGLRHKGGPKFL